MNWDAQTILAVVGIVLAVGGLIKPQWPLVAVSCLLIGVAVLIGAK